VSGLARVRGFLGRHAAYVLAVVGAGLLVTVAPGVDQAVRSGARDAAGGFDADSGADAGTPGDLEGAGGSTATVPGDGTVTGAVGGRVRTGADSGTTSASSVSAPGFNSAEALAAPDCDASVGKLRISFTWRPACVVPWPEGANNGGATYQGVTAETIKVVRYNDPVQPVSDADLKRRWQTSLDLYERFYRTWGRKVENIVVGKSGDDEVAQRADAVKIANHKPFAVIGVVSSDHVLISELAARKIVVITNSNVTVELSTKLAPYVWGVTIQSDEHVALNAGEYAGKRLVGLPARWAGQADFRVTTRKFGLIYPDTLDPSYFTKAFAKHGGTLTEAISYPAGQDNASLWGERAQVIAARLKNRGVTTVVAITDLLFTGPMTHSAAGQNWFPEWVTTGYLAQDLDIVASTFNQAQWRNAFGPAGIPIASAPEAPWPQYWFYNWYWGAGYARGADGRSQTSDDNQNGPAHSEATVLFAGIHGAGPNLTPETFRDGVFALPPAGGASVGGKVSAQQSFGRHGFFPWDDYNAFDDFDEVYWDPTAVAPDLVTGQNTAGHYRHLNGGRRYTVDQWPAGEPKMFDPAGTEVFYFAYPPEDRPPDYECPADCPSRR
jgi:hypothetical protein